MLNLILSTPGNGLQVSRLVKPCPCHARPFPLGKSWSALYSDCRLISVIFWLLSRLSRHWPGPKKVTLTDQWSPTISNIPSPGCFNKIIGMHVDNSRSKQSPQVSICIRIWFIYSHCALGHGLLEFLHLRPKIKSEEIVTKNLGIIT